MKALILTLKLHISLQRVFLLDHGPFSKFVLTLDFEIRHPCQVEEVLHHMNDLHAPAPNDTDEHIKETTCWRLIRSILTHQSPSPRYNSQHSGEVIMNSEVAHSRSVGHEGEYGTHERLL